MFDNGLLKYYREKAYKDGFLSARDVGLHSIKKIDCEGRIRLCRTNVCRFYTKLPRGKDNSRAFDPEILLSQIYAKAGIESAIYLPINTYKGQGVISNDVAVDEENVIPACDYFDFYIDPYDRYELTFLDSLNTNLNLPNYFTRNALQQQTKMRILDTASYNTDRHDSNYFYRIIKPNITKGNNIISSPTLLGQSGILRPIAIQDDSHYFYEGSPSTYARSFIERMESIMQGTNAMGNEEEDKILADDVISIDYELSGYHCFSRMQPNVDIEKMNEEGGYLYSDFNIEKLPRDSILKEFRDNLLFSDLVDKKAIAEEIGSLNPMGVAQDIEQTIGYKFDPKYPEFLERSYDEVAEALIQ